MHTDKNFRFEAIWLIQVVTYEIFFIFKNWKWLTHWNNSTNQGKANPHFEVVDFFQLVQIDFTKHFSAFVFSHSARFETKRYLGYVLLPFFQTLFGPCFQTHFGFAFLWETQLVHYYPNNLVMIILYMPKVQGLRHVYPCCRSNYNHFLDQMPKNSAASMRIAAAALCSCYVTVTFACWFEQGILFYVPVIPTFTSNRFFVNSILNPLVWNSIFFVKLEFRIEV